MLTGLLLFATIVLKGFPETAAARWMLRQIAATGAALRRIERKHLVFVVLMSVILIAGSEMLAIAGPFDMTLVLMWDVSAYIDIALTTLVVATAARGGSGWRAIVARFAPRRKPRARRTRTARKATPPANEDDRPAFALAA